MSFWEIINSPLVIGLISLLWGSIVASGITYLWQKRAYQHQLKIRCANDLIEIYQEYIRFIRGTAEKFDNSKFDEIHSEMISKAKIAGLLFKNKNIGKQWEQVAGKLANIRSLILDGRDEKLVQRKMKEVFTMGNQAEEIMFKELS